MITGLGHASSLPRGGAAIKESASAKGPEEMGLPVGAEPDFIPELILSDSSLGDIAGDLAGPDTLFVTDQYNYARLKDLGPTVEVQATTAEQVHQILDLPEFPSYRWVVGVGGCAALDVAKAVAVHKHLKVIPTLLSTNCITKNRSVIGTGLDAVSYRTATPEEVIVPVEELARQDEPTRTHWSQSGWGDFFAKVSAMIDQEWEKDGLASLDRMQEIDPTIVAGLEWVNHNFHGYDRDSLAHLAEVVHDAGVRVVEVGRNDISIGGEHKFYKAMMELYPHLRHLPSHGQVVAIGTLVAARAYSEEQQMPELYDTVRAAFEKLEIPTSYEELEKVGITREVLERCLDRIGQPPVKSTFLGSYFQSHGFELLDDVFGEPAQPWLLA